MTTPFVRLVLAAPVLLVACGSPGPTASTVPAGAPADVIYVGGDIVTVDDAQPSAEALAVKDGKILAVGTRADVEAAHKAGGDDRRGSRGQDAAARVHRPARPLHQLVDGGQPGQRVRAAGRAGDRPGGHRRGDREVPRRRSPSPQAS